MLAFQIASRPVGEWLHLRIAHVRNTFMETLHVRDLITDGDVATSSIISESYGAFIALGASDGGWIVTISHLIALYLYSEKGLLLFAQPRPQTTSTAGIGASQQQVKTLSRKPRWVEFHQPF